MRLGVEPALRGSFETRGTRRAQGGGCSCVPEACPRGMGGAVAFVRRAFMMGGNARQTATAFN